MTSSYAWIIFADIVCGVGAAALGVTVQLRLLASPLYSLPTLYAITLLWAYLGYLWAQGDGPLGLAGWATAGAAIAYVDKAITAQTNFSRDLINIADIGGLVMIEMLMMTFAGVYFLVAAHVPSLPAIAVTLIAVFTYKPLLKKLTRTVLVYPIVAASVAAWVFLSYWISHDLMGLDQTWQLGAAAIVGFLVFWEKRTLLNTYRKARDAQTLVKCLSCPQYHFVSARTPQAVTCDKCGTNFISTPKRHVA